MKGTFPYIGEIYARECSLCNDLEANLNMYISLHNERNQETLSTTSVYFAFNRNVYFVKRE